MYKTWYQFEINQRNEIEKKLQDQAAKIPIYDYKPITVMENRDKVPEDRHQCKFCTDFAYASMIKCNVCKI